MKTVEEKRKPDKKPEKKVSSSVLAKQRYKRRRLLTFGRMFKYGFSSFLRNSWLSAAATIVMTMTLMIIFVTFVSHTIMTDTVNDLRKKVDMSIYLKTDTTDQTGKDLIAELMKLSSVQSVKFISAEKAREQMIENSNGETDIINAITEATNKNPATLRVVVRDINDTSELEGFVAKNKTIKQYLSTTYKPSFAGERRNTIKSIGRAVSFVQSAGLIMGAVFVIISSLIIFNTIRMAIFNRKEEIQMMKLIGADKSFIRGPFLVESAIYGMIAAFFASGLGYWGLFSASKLLASYQIIVQPTINLFTVYSWAMVLGMIAAGSIIGVTSSLLATHRFLKI